MPVPWSVRGILQGVLVFVLLVVVTFLTIFAANFVHRIKAESLLKDIQNLHVEQSTTADVQRIMNRHGGGPSQGYASFCTPMDGAYTALTGSQTINWLDRSVPVLKRLGLRQWNTGATVILRRGRVCYLSYGVGMEDPSGEWEWGIQSNLLPSGQISPYEGQHVAYRVGTRDHKGIRKLRSELTPEATEEQRRRAFSIDFSCVTNLGGCQQRCEIAPLMWQDVYRRSLEEGWAMPAEETKDPRCKFAEQSQ